VRRSCARLDPFHGIGQFPSSPQGLVAVNGSKDHLVVACLGEEIGSVRIDLMAINKALKRLLLFVHATQF